jgi:outer membrane lipoprotein SlyB
MILNKTRGLWMGTLVLASAGALMSACGPQDGSSASKTVQAPVAAAPIPAPMPVADPAPAPQASTPPPAPVAKPAPVHVAKPTVKATPVKAQAAPEVKVAAAPEVKVAAAPPPNTVGAVRQIDPITETHASGVGAVAGGALGGVLGHQFGKGDGKKAMTLLGAVGGAVAGHQVEKARNTKVVGYRVQVQLDNGETRTFEPTELDGLKVGDRVRVEQGTLRRV